MNGTLFQKNERLFSDWGDRAFIILLVAAFFVVFATFRDYGLSWDEHIHFRRGEQIIHYIFSGFNQLPSSEGRNFMLYGGLFDALKALLILALPFDIADSLHLANALSGLAGVVGCFMTARLVAGPKAGFWSALFLLSCAPWYGHMFINPKDIPFAVGFIWGIYSILYLIREFPLPSFRARVYLGLGLGASLGIRVGGIMLVALLFLMGITYLVWSYYLDRSTATTWTRAKDLFFIVLPSLVIAYVIMIAAWPEAHYRPIMQPLESFLAFSNFKWDAFMWVRFKGDWIWASDVPWYYLPVIFGIELPEYLVLLLLFALPWNTYTVVRAVRNRRFIDASQIIFLLATVLSPPLYAILTKSTLYDEMRHFLFLLPPLVCLGGIAWAAILSEVENRMRPAFLSLLGLMIVLQTAQAYRMTTLHPYEYIFKNLFAGGTVKAAENYETDYWITSYRESANLIVKHSQKAAENAGIPFENLHFTVAVIGEPETVSLFLPSNFDTFKYYPPELYYPPQRSLGPPTEQSIMQNWVNLDPDADYVVATPRFNFDKMSPGYPILAKVTKLGVTLAVIKVRADIPH